jgi:hypothetical protein
VYGIATVDASTSARRKPEFVIPSGRKSRRRLHWSKSTPLTDSAT